MPNFTPDFIKKFHDRKAVLFLGAGVSLSSGIPKMSDLLELAKADKWLFDIIEREQIKNFANLASHCKENGAEEVFNQFLAKSLGRHNTIISQEYTILSFLIKKKFIKAVYTTNQDTLLEQALDRNGVQYNRYIYPFAGKPKNNLNENIDIFKLCGDIHDIQSMCFSNDDIIRASQSVTFNHFEKSYADTSGGDIYIFIGYSFYSDAIGKRIRELSENNRNHTYCANISFKETVNPLTKGDKTLINEIQFAREGKFECSASKFLSDLVYEIKPQISVAHVTFDNTKFGGVQTYYHYLKKICEDKGKVNEQKMIFCEYPTNNFLHEKFINRKEEPLYGHSYLKASASKTVYEVMGDKNFDVIHAHNPISASKAMQMGVPVVLTSHSLESKEAEYIDDKPSIAFIDDVKRDEHEYFSLLSNIITLSEAHKKDIPPIISHAADVIKAPFIFNSEAPLDSSKARAILKTNKNINLRPSKRNVTCELDANKFTVLYAGRSTNRKGIALIVYILNSLYKEPGYGNDVQTILVGPKIEADDKTTTITVTKEASGSASTKEYETKIEKTISDYTFYCNVDIDAGFENNRRNMNLLYQSADVIIMPSDYEPFGYVALETLAQKRPVIAYKVGGLCEILGDDRGYLVEKSGNIEEAAKKFCRIIYDIRRNKEYSCVAEKGYEWVKSEYMAEKIESDIKDKMYRKYIKAIIHSDDKAVLFKNEQEENSIKEKLQNSNKLEDIIYEAIKIRRDILKEIPQKTSANVEDSSVPYHSISWEMAKWLKTIMPMNDVLNGMPIKDLAELITNVERVLREIENL